MRRVQTTAEEDRLLERLRTETLLAIKSVTPRELSALANLSRKGLVTGGHTWYWLTDAGALQSAPREARL